MVMLRREVFKVAVYFHGDRFIILVGFGFESSNNFQQKKAKVKI